MLTLILDTNVVLDWLVFNDLSLASLTDFIKEKRVSVLSHPALRNELRRVLNYPILKLDANRQQQVYLSYQSLCREATVPSELDAHTLLLPENFPRCRDPDDQLFLALALHTKADGLVSRDRAVLAVRKKVRKFGVTVMGVDELLIQIAKKTRTVGENGPGGAEASA